ncbi:AI-2E family transporter [Caulobacter sp. KR2-114]|uniref:AI-2E family transporter n=1 Tax=Caulobacter sp. KR2-114 TaxID=3400912 RepID=UPI003C031FCA
MAQPPPKSPAKTAAKTAPAAKAPPLASTTWAVRPPPPDHFVRNATVFIAVVVALALIKYFQSILTPLVVATFLLLLIDAVARVLHDRMPSAPDWVRGAIAGSLILAAFGAIGGLFAVEAPPFAGQIAGLEPRINAVIAQVMGMAHAQPLTIGQIFSGGDPSHALTSIFATARSLLSYGFLVIIYFGFLVASRAAFSQKVNSLYDTEAHRQGARRILASVRNAVEQYVRLQTLKAAMIALAAWALMFLFKVNDALFIAFVVFLAAYVPIVGAIAGSLFPGLVALSQFSTLTVPALLIAILGSAVFVIDNVVMPKLQSDELNIDPLLVLISIGFWGAILGAPGILLSTPLTVTVMAIAAEFESTRWLAVMISKDGHPIKGATEA